MLPYPHIDPVILNLGFGGLKIRWYGVMYIISFVLGWMLSRYRAKRFHLPWKTDQITDLIFYAMFGVLLGGRLGYFLFYTPHRLWEAPFDLLKIWQGGMSFHGGLLGVGIAFLLYGHWRRRSFFAITDFIVPVVPLGLIAGRLGNFINGELWGRITTVPWGMVFPHAGHLPRHPSQLYEALLEGVLLGAILWYYGRKQRALGALTACFLTWYGALRFLVEFFRQPDWQLGFVFGPLTMGQLLSIPMVCIGICLWYFNAKKAKNNVK